VAVATGAALMTGVPASAHDRELPPGRRVVTYTVKPGDTATELAVRFHAWTDELISHNHLGSRASLRVGQRLRIPVVLAAVRRDAAKPRRARAAAQRRAAHGKATARRAPAKPRTARSAARRVKPWQQADPSRPAVRRLIVRMSRRVGVDPELALAVSWQEAGWQMHHVSSANAIGAMQVLPTTGAWMSLYAGRPLRLRHTGDNILAGVLLLKVLDDNTRTRPQQVAAYYQGLGAVRRHGLYDETKRYVRNVLVIKRRLERGQTPA
jgi:soluble lytic murein transglycosylase-like protein